MPDILKDPAWMHAKRKVYSVEMDEGVTIVAKIMRDSCARSIIITDGGKPVGILTRSDLINKVLAEPKNPATTRASEAMSSPLIVVKTDSTVEEALLLMEKHQVKRVVVVNSDGKPYGILEELKICGDIVGKKIERSEIEPKSWLEQYILEVSEHELDLHPEIKEEL